MAQRICTEIEPVGDVCVCLCVYLKNINKLRYANDTTLMEESKEELKSLLKVQEESEKADLKLNI